MVTEKREDICKRKADELFDQIKSGDQKALELLFSIYFPRLNDFARNVVKDDVIDHVVPFQKDQLIPKLRDSKFLRG